MTNETFIYDLKYYLLISFIRLIHDIIFFPEYPLFYVALLTWYLIFLTHEKKSFLKLKHNVQKFKWKLHTLKFFK
jgi:hypothetical protein